MPEISVIVDIYNCVPFLQESSDLLYAKHVRALK